MESDGKMLLTRCKLKTGENIPSSGSFWDFRLQQSALVNLHLVVPKLIASACNVQGFSFLKYNSTILWLIHFQSKSLPSSMEQRQSQPKGEVVTNLKYNGCGC
jgi:hypothetical protein